MSLVSFVGPRPNLLDINNVNPPLRLELSQPILGMEEMAKMRRIDRYTGDKFRSWTKFDTIMIVLRGAKKV